MEIGGLGLDETLTGHAREAERGRAEPGTIGGVGRVIASEFPAVSWDAVSDELETRAGTRRVERRHDTGGRHAWLRAMLAALDRGRDRASVLENDAGAE